MLCHYGAFAYAMLLPISLKNNAVQFAEILANICAQIVVTDEYHYSQIEFRASVVNIPEDCQTLERMLEIAEIGPTMD